MSAITPTVSICLPTLNARAFLAERMTSIFAQTLRDWELIVCDSHSDDGTWEYLKKFQNDPRVKLFRVPKAGLYAGWNDCLVRATGKYIHFATADDTCDHTFLQQLVEKLEANPEAKLAYSRFRWLDEKGEEIKPYPARWGKYFAIYSHLLSESHSYSHISQPAFNIAASIYLAPIWISMSTVVFARDLLQHTGLFPLNLKSLGDVLWAYKTATLTSYIYVSECLATFRQHDTQATSKCKVFDAVGCRILALKEFRKFLASSRPPDNWKNLPWEQELFERAHSEHLSRIRLHRGLLRTEPAEFFSQLFWLLRHEPRHALSRITRGFPYINNSIDMAKNWENTFCQLTIPKPLPI